MDFHEFCAHVNVYYDYSHVKPIERTVLEEEIRLHIVREVNLHRSGVCQLCVVLPVVEGSTIEYSVKNFMYDYLKYCQGTKFAATAVHTNEIEHDSTSDWLV